MLEGAVGSISTNMHKLNYDLNKRSYLLMPLRVSIYHDRPITKDHEFSIGYKTIRCGEIPLLKKASACKMFLAPRGCCHKKKHKKMTSRVPMA